MDQKKLKHLYYELSAFYLRILRSEKWFMNYGYLEDKEIKLDPEDERYRFHIQLYDHILQSEKISGKKILEVSCGRGGGCNYYMKYHKPDSYVGIDLAKNNIALCRSNNKYKNADFFLDDAQSFYFLPKTFDVVINLEASHNYPDKNKFFANVFKHLNNGGLFILSDIYPSHKPNDIKEAVLSMGFTLKIVEDISPGVIRSIELNTKKWYPLSNRFPKLIPKKIKNMQGNTESPLYKKLKSGEMKYVSFVFSK